ncbi:MAG TPA: helix-hairpin-helix domain-containing protein [Pirellulales bacterium]|nr:helix-hairpin-helix domain-containing protein [Pirellulales bacterium]
MGAAAEPEEPMPNDALEAAADATAKLTPLAVFPRRIATALNRYGVVAVEDLANWNTARLLLIPGFGPRELSQVALALARLKMPSLLGSAGNVLDSLPNLDPGAIDRNLGRTPEEVDHFLRELASGVPDREVSAEMGAQPAWYGYPHQCAQSLKSRHRARYVQFLLEQFKTEFKGEDWWVSASVERTSVARCRANKGDPDRAAWCLRLVIRVTEEEAAKQLAGAVKIRGRWQWRSVGIAFDETLGC